tara:strand:- start:916 stop:1401 length:486 start_codon:yes stop_codon:yes gene_type:complete
MMIMDTKKIMCTELVLILISACDLFNFEDEDNPGSGYAFSVLNFTDKEYDGFVLYAGSLKSGVFIKKDSLVGNNIKIYKKDEGPYSSTNSNGTKVSYISSTKEFKDLKGLNKYGKWDASTGNTRPLFFKVKLSDGTIIEAKEEQLGPQVNLELKVGGNSLY